MSGGNQQKAIVAREIDRSPHLLIAMQPTRGLDVGAIDAAGHAAGDGRCALPGADVVLINQPIGIGADVLAAHSRRRLSRAKSTARRTC